MTYYDSYGNGPDVFVHTGWHSIHSDTTRRNGNHRYIVWFGSPTSKTGQRKTYRTVNSALRRAKKLAKRGLSVRVSDRLIRPGDTGFLAGNLGSYYMEPDRTLHTGTFDEIQTLLKETGYWNTPRSRVSVGTMAPNESVSFEVRDEAE